MKNATGSADYAWTTFDGYLLMDSPHFDAWSDPDAPPLPQGGSSGRRCANGASSATLFIGIQYRCCRVYGRLYRSADRAAYQGRCPKCGRRVTVPIGEGGSNTRFFSAG